MAQAGKPGRPACEGKEVIGVEFEDAPRCGHVEAVRFGRRVGWASMLKGTIQCRKGSDR